MNFGHHPSQYSSKLVVTYDKLFQGFTPEQISPYEDSGTFFSNLLSSDVDHDYIEKKLSELPKDLCLGNLKPFLNSLFLSCLIHARAAPYEDSKKKHSLETLSTILRAILGKNLTGWEVMEIIAGGASHSDAVFMEFAALIDHILADSSAPAGIRHQVLQLALIFMCGVGQLSPGAYLLRRDLFPSIVIFIKSSDTEQFTFEAVLLLSILANFHKSDAAKLNPYLQRIKGTKDKDLMRKICWASNFAIDAAVKAYREISDDSPPTLTTTLGSLIASLRPDRALTATSIDPPRVLFQNQPIEASVILLAVFEFTRINPVFSAVLLEYISPDSNESNRPTPLSPPPFTILTLSSYLLTHASSSPRAIAYANLCLNILLAFAEDDEVMSVFCQPTQENIWLCRQRLPVLPLPRSARPPVCALLDCCVLWLRHNLHKRLEVASYMTCIWICYRLIWFLHKGHIRLEYDWGEFWSAIIGLLSFLSTKLDSLTTTGGVEQLARETINLLEFSLCESETFLPTPRSIHEFVYELVRSSPILKKQMSLLKTLAMPQFGPRRTSWVTEKPTEKLSHILTVTDFYEERVEAARARTAKDAMRVVASEIEADGLHGMKVSREMEEPPKRSQDVLSFARHACMDGLSLMP